MSDEATRVAELRHDLLVAAQIGQQLMEDNARLKETIEATKQRYEEAQRRLVAEREGADDENARLEARCSELEAAARQRDREDTQRGGNDAAVYNEVKKQLALADERNAELEQSLAQAHEANARLIAELRECNLMVKQQATLLSLKEDTLDQFKVGQQTWQTERSALEHRCARLEEQVQLAQTDAEIYSSLNAQLEQERQEKEAYEFQVDELNIALADARTTIEFLKKAVQAESRVGDLPGHEDGKSLFFEVEERRLEAEKLRSDLHNKNQHLIQEQRMLKNRFRQLSQCKNNEQPESAQRQIEARLVQEKKQLQEENIVLKKRVDNCTCTDSYGQTLGVAAGLKQRLASLEGEGALHTMAQQLLDVTNELDQTKRELRTTTMLKVSESESLFQTGRRLHESEMQLDRANRMIVQLRLQLEEGSSMAPAPANKENSAPTTSPVPAPQPSPPTTTVTPSTDAASLTMRDSSVKPTPPSLHVASPLKVQAPLSPANKHVTSASSHPMMVSTGPRPKQVHVKRENVNECSQQ